MNNKSTRTLVSASSLFWTLSLWFWHLCRNILRWPRYLIELPHVITLSFMHSPCLILQQCGCLFTCSFAHPHSSLGGGVFVSINKVSSGSLEYCVWLEKNSEPIKWFYEIGQVSTGHGKGFLASHHGDTCVLLFLVGAFLCFLREGLQQSFFGWWVLIPTWRRIPSLMPRECSCGSDHETLNSVLPWVVWSIKRAASHSASGAKPRGDARPEGLFVRETISKDKPQTFSVHYKTHPGFCSEF